jgi:radical SAM superfamily enzyme YgiQ (UPF0313 family)
MIDVLFTHSYFLNFDPKEFKGMMPYPPLGTLYAASYARQHGYSVSLFDSMLAVNEDDILPALRQHQPRTVVIYDDDFNYLTKMCLSRMREAAFRMTEIAKREGCLVVVHGSDPVDHLESYVAHGADVIICGEGELTLIEVLDALLRGTRDKNQVPGIAYAENGHIRRTSDRAVQRDLDQFPFPARDLVDTEKYRSVWRKHHNYFSVNMVTTRGCPFHCNWCAKPIYGQVYNSRSPQNVVQEMKLVKQTIQPDHIWFCDDIFGLKPGWVGQFSEEVLRQDAMIPFKCLGRADLLLKEDAIEHLRKAGCRTVWIGAESGSQKILDAMDKGTTVEQIYETTRRLKKAGIAVGFFLQYGYPGETQEDIALTLRMVKECSPDEIGVSVSYPLPGTKFYEKVKREMGEKRNWVDSKDLALMFSGTYPPDYYRALHRLTHKKFRVWKMLESLRNGVYHPRRFHPSSFRSLLAGVYHSITLPLVQLELSGFQARSERQA